MALDFFAVINDMNGESGGTVPMLHGNKCVFINLITYKGIGAPSNRHIHTIVHVCGLIILFAWHMRTPNSM